MASIRSINEALPRIDRMRRDFMLHGETGFAHGRGFLSVAYADLDEAGNVTEITLYAVGDARAERHYYEWPSVVNITDQIESALNWERRSEFRGNSREFRLAVCYNIQEAVKKTSG